MFTMLVPERHRRGDLGDRRELRERVAHRRLAHPEAAVAEACRRARRTAAARPATASRDVPRPRSGRGARRMSSPGPEPAAISVPRRARRRRRPTVRHVVVSRRSMADRLGDPAMSARPPGATLGRAADRDGRAASRSPASSNGRSGPPAHRPGPSRSGRRASTNANVPPGRSHAGDRVEASVEARARPGVAPSANAAKTASTVRSAGASRSRRWRWARRPCATRRCRSRSRAASLGS